MASKTNYNNAPYGILELGATAMTEFVRTAQQLQNDPLAEFLPDKSIPTKRVEVKMKDGNLRVTGIVTPMMPNGLNKWDRAKTFSYEPALFRRGQFIDQETVNFLVDGNSYDKAYGMDLIQAQIQDLVNQGNMMNTIMRAQLLTGGVNITDSETGVTVEAESGMDASKQTWTVGKAETALASDKTWDDPEADILDQLFRLRRYAKLYSLAEPDTIIINGAIHELWLRNTKIRTFVNPLQGSNNTLGWVTFRDGKITEIMGMRVVICDTLYDVDNGDGTTTRKFVIPVTRAIMLTTKHPMLPGEKLGYTVLAKGESIDGRPGPWVRTFDQQQMGGPTAAPGLGIQFGMSSLPVLYYPKWVHNIIVGTLENITAIVGSAYAS